jgi:transposase
VSKARLIITAVVVEGRSPSEVARTYGVARSWVCKLVKRSRTEGDVAFEARSRRPHTRPDATPDATVDLVLKLRRRLSLQGLDAGADTIGWHLEHHHQLTVSRATIYRIIRRAGLITAEPKKKPKASYVRFAAEQPNTFNSEGGALALLAMVDGAPEVIDHLEGRAGSETVPRGAAGSGVEGDVQPPAFARRSRTAPSCREIAVSLHDEGCPVKNDNSPSGAPVAPWITTVVR